MRSDGEHELQMRELAGKVVLVVNTARLCGFAASNNAQLTELAERLFDRGLRIVLFPCNEFLGQEPDDDAQIGGFCARLSPRFVVLQKGLVNGAQAAPLYAWLKRALRDWRGQRRIRWNYTKVRRV